MGAVSEEGFIERSFLHMRKNNLPQQVESKYALESWLTLNCVMGESVSVVAGQLALLEKD